MIEHHCILIEISLKFVPKSAIHKYVSIGSDNGLVQTGNRPLSESMLIKFCDVI